LGRESIVAKPAAGAQSPLGRLKALLGINTRMLAMLATLVVVALVFNIFSHGLFLSPRNLWNLAVQTSVVGIISSGMVLVIVSRNIDLSVGSLEAFLGLSGAFLQLNVLHLGAPGTWWISILFVLAIGGLCGAAQGAITAYLGLPSFVVTLAGLMAWRAVAWLVTRGETVTPLDSTYSLFGDGSIGVVASWIVGVAIVAIVAALVAYRRVSRNRVGFQNRPGWLDVALIALVAIVVFSFVMTMNAYTYPKTGLGRGIPVPVLTLIVIAGLMSYLASMTRFGRYIYGYGGNPEAAELAGVQTKRVVTIAFAIIGVLTGVGAVITTARLNAAPLSIGQLLELQVIAACVIGGTSLAGGSGSIFGAIVGATLIQSLLNGLVLLGVDSAEQQIVEALVLLAAVWFDTMYQRRSA
jgi:D-xylose transport system permease protein